MASNQQLNPYRGRYPVNPPSIGLAGELSVISLSVEHPVNPSSPPSHLSTVVAKYTYLVLESMVQNSFTLHDTGSGNNDILIILRSSFRPCPRLQLNWSVARPLLSENGFQMYVG